MTMDRLLAKSGIYHGRAITIGDHIRDVIEAADALFGQPDNPTNLAGLWCRFFGLDVSDLHPFLRHVRAAAFCHDWGKANDGFQQMVQRRGSQLLRHERVSTIMMCWPSIREWLESGGYDVPLLLSAVVGHHLKIRDAEEFEKPESEVDQGLHLLWSDTGFRDWLSNTAPSLGLSSNVPADVPQLCTFGGEMSGHDLYALIDAVLEHLEALERELRPSVAEPRLRMLWAVRAALIAADAAGSALPREGKSIREWITQCMRYDGVGSSAEGRMTGDTIRHHVINPRIEVIKKDGKWTGLNRFQEACGEPAHVPDRSLLLAPCGSGKTLAAWRWVAARLDEQPRGRAIFLYPTRGTATEGYRDYTGLAGDGIAALMHGTADLDLDDIVENAPDDIDRRIDEARLHALRQWNRRLFSATVDQFLAFMQHGYAATCQLPLLTEAVIVLDEVHCYDRGMWSALTEFLHAFPRVPVLCMTATLLSRRIGELESLGLRIVNGLDLDGGDGSALQRAAEHGRYRIRRVDDHAAARGLVELAMQKGKRVLWVVNTVDRCQTITREFAADPRAEHLQASDGLPLFCYHSRFTLRDRKQWHRAVVDAFKTNAASEGVLAITTQVCEMSLDLDADLLVTEQCPATALVQRMGRCCRDPQAHEIGRTGEVVIYPPESEKPYTKGDLEGVDRIVATMIDEGIVSQERLAELLEHVNPPLEMPKACRFTQSGVWAAAGEEQFRDGDDFTRPAVLADEVDEYARLRDPKRRGDAPPWKADELVVNVPKKLVAAHGRHDLPRWLGMATGGAYRPALGFCAGEVPAAVVV